MTKRYIVIEVDEDWHANAAMDEVQALPCASHFWGPMSAREAALLLLRKDAEGFPPLMDAIEEIRATGFSVDGPALLAELESGDEL